MRLLAKCWTNTVKRLLLITGVALLSACASVSPQSERVAKVDPLEGLIAASLSSTKKSMSTLLNQ